MHVSYAVADHVQSYHEATSVITTNNKSTQHNRDTHEVYKLNFAGSKNVTLDKMQLHDN